MIIYKNCRVFILLSSSNYECRVHKNLVHSRERINRTRLVRFFYNVTLYTFNFIFAYHIIQDIFIQINFSKKFS